MLEEVILVTDTDRPTGTMEKMEAHRQPTLHRAFSVFLFNQQNKMLLQQRAHSKYHSAGLWTNTCCSHPRPGEDVTAAATRRLREEMGIENARIDKAFEFVYQAAFDNGLYEYEYDHVFKGIYHGPVLVNPTEVAGYCFKSIEEIKTEIAQQPGLYTAWFKIALPKLEAFIAQNKGA